MGEALPTPPENEQRMLIDYTMEAHDAADDLIVSKLDLAEDHSDPSGFQSSEKIDNEDILAVTEMEGVIQGSEKISL